MMLMTDRTLTPYSPISYHNEELKSLTRYRFSLIQRRAKLKTSVSRLVSILFPELERLVSSIHLDSIYDLLTELPGASDIAEAHLTHLTHLLSASSKGRFNRDIAITIRDAARHSIGPASRSKALELRQTIRSIRLLSEEIEKVEGEILKQLETIDTPLLTIPGIGFHMSSIILAEIGDFSRFRNADQVLAFSLHLPVREAHIEPFQDGETRFSLSPLRAFQRYDIRLQMG